MLVPAQRQVVFPRGEHARATLRTLVGVQQVISHCYCGNGDWHLHAKHMNCMRERAPVITLTPIQLCMNTTHEHNPGYEHGVTDRVIPWRHEFKN